MAQATRKNTRTAAAGRRGGATAAPASRRSAKGGDRRRRRGPAAGGTARRPASHSTTIPRARVVRPAAASVLATAGAVRPQGSPDLTEEQQIGSTKYQLGSAEPRVFEEERFIFPETYGADRVRLLVKDPEWLFAFWDVSPGTWSAMNQELGQRAAKLSKLTLKVADAASGGDQLILVPGHARAWYVRVDTGRRAYRAEIGFTLPSGQFRSVARSNTIQTPWLGASADKSARVARYDEPFVGLPRSPAGEAGPWQTEPIVDGPLAGAKQTRERGGASDRYRR